MPITVTSEDQFGNVATDDASAFTISAGLGGPVLAAGTLSNGTATVTIAPLGGGIADLDGATADATETGTAGPVAVAAAAATQLILNYHRGRRRRGRHRVHRHRHRQGPVR